MSNAIWVWNTLRKSKHCGWREGHRFQEVSVKNTCTNHSKFLCQPRGETDCSFGAFLSDSSKYCFCSCSWEPPFSVRSRAGVCQTFCHSGNFNNLGFFLFTMRVRRECCWMGKIYFSLFYFYRQKNIYIFRLADWKRETLSHTRSYINPKAISLTQTAIHIIHCP